MTLDVKLLKKCTAKAERVIEMEQKAELAKIEYHAAIRRLHLAGGTYREIASALGLSHQRISQIVTGGSSNWLSRWMGKNKEAKRLKCSFCDQSSQQVEKLVAGPHVHICDECINHALSLTTNSSAKGVPKFLSVKSNDDARCSFCARQQDGNRILFGTDNENMCTGCLAVAKDIIAQGVH